MNERIKDLAKSVQCERHWTENDIEQFGELVVRECAKWMSDGNIPNGFYEAGRFLKHFGIEE